MMSSQIVAMKTNGSLGTIRMDDDNRVLTTHRKPPFRVYTPGDLEILNAALGADVYSPFVSLDYQGGCTMFCQIKNNGGSAFSWLADKRIAIEGSPVGTDEDGGEWSTSDSWATVLADASLPSSGVLPDGEVFVANLKADKHARSVRVKVPELAGTSFWSV